MYPVIDFNVIKIPTYGLIATVGFLLAMLLYLHTAKLYKLPRSDVFYASIYGLVGLIIGAKLVFVLTTLPKVLHRFDILLKYPLETLSIAFGGWVFYGGLIGLALGIFIYCKKFHMEFLRFVDAIAPVIPFFHGFGRIACHMAGCCYGMVYHGPLAVWFPHNHFTAGISGVPRFPTQLTEAIFNFILCVILYYYIQKQPRTGRPLGIYLTSYALMRFVMEFFRGDIARGALFGLATSQWISMVLLPVGIWLIVRRRHTVSE